MTPAHLDLLLETCLLAGKIMIESDAEMYRVEDTMSRIALASGNYRMVSYVTQTGLFVGIDGTSTIRMVQVMKRGIDLEKISRVNQLSRAYVAGDFSLEELLNKLKVIDSEHRHFPISARIVSAAVVSATIMILFGGVWSDLFLTFLIGGCGYSLYYFSLKFLKIKFLSEFLASLFIGAAAILSVKLGLGQSQDLIIIGCVMPLVPGVQITNALRDLLAGHYLSGVSPRRSLVACGLTGSVSWMLYWVIVEVFSRNAALGSLIGAVGVAAVSYLFSKILKMPVTIFNIPGIVPLVPGGLAYQAVRNIVIGNYEKGAYFTVQAVMIAGAIALGLVASEVFNQNIRSFREKRESLGFIRRKRNKIKK